MPSVTYSQPCKCKVNHAHRQQLANATLAKRAQTSKRPPRKSTPVHSQPNDEAPISTQPFPFTSLPYDIQHNIYRFLLVSPQDIVVKNYSISGISRKRYKVEPGTELLHRSYSNDAIWKEATEIYYAENTFAMTKFTMSYFLLAAATFPSHEMHRPRELIRNVKLTAGCLSELSFRSAVRQIDILLRCPRLKNLTLEYWAFLIPYHRNCALSNLYLTGRLALIMDALRKLKAHVGKNMVLITSDSGTIPFEARYNGRDCIGTKEDLSWLLDIPSETIKEKVINGRGSLRECLTVEMATKWAPPLMKG